MTKKESSRKKLHLPNLEPKNYSREEVESIIKNEKITMSQFLQKFQEEGYLLHGSPFDNIIEFEPRLPEDNTGGWTAQKGVYAQSDTQPIFFSIIHREKAKGSSTFKEVRYTEGSRYMVSKNIIDNEAVQSGFVYILDKKGFSPDPSKSGEWINPDPVKPLGKVPVEPEDLENSIEIIEDSA